jgi:hypothetical protein
MITSFTTLPINLEIYNASSEEVTLYHFGSIGNPTEQPISITANSKIDTHQIYNTSPKLSA